MNKNILIVDDETILLELLADELEEIDGTTIYTAENGAEALKIIESNKVDVVLTDFKMPIMDGAELITKIYEKLSKNDITVFMMTAYSPEDIQDLLEQYQIRLIKKPFNFSEIKNTILNN